MSGFDLIPVHGGDPVHLPPGETVLGRGPFLAVSDKRVSRHHGLLENLNGQLRLKPTHLNPCFVQPSLTDDPQPLQRDSWHLLHHGDFFSLLPGQFVYKVVVVGEEERTPRNSQMFAEEEEELPVSPQPDVDRPPAGRDGELTPARDDRTSAAPLNEGEAGCPSRSLKQGHSARSVEDDQSGAAPSAPRRRVLPPWMMAAAAAPRTSSSTLRVQSPVKRSEGPAAPSTSTKQAATTQATPTVTSSLEEVVLSEEEQLRPRKKRRKMSEEETPQTHTDVSSSEGSHGSHRFSMEEAAGGSGDASTRTPGVSQSEKEDETDKLTSERAESVGSNGGSASVPAPSKPRGRTPCPYRKDCYRKNPLHFQECSHPGDTDYEEEEGEEEEEEDRPECPYGTDCYRKNPLHKKDYKHTKKPARTTRPVARNTPDDDEGEDFGDDDSFINDDSEDVGEDSDYVPPVSDDSGKEDVTGLQKEAKAFLRRRK